jgi:hypothetical protein
VKVRYQFWRYQNQRGPFEGFSGSEARRDRSASNGAEIGLLQAAGWNYGTTIAWLESPRGNIRNSPRAAASTRRRRHT